MLDDPIYVLAVLSAAVAISEWLTQKTVLRHVGTALLVIVVVAVLANLGVVPVYDAAGPLPLYDGIFGYGVYVGVFWLLLRVRLADVRRAGRSMLFLFAAGATGTVCGVLAGMAVVGGEDAFGPLSSALGGMFVATYTGGSANLNIIAAEYEVAKDGLLYTGANAVDAILTTVWMVGTIAIPRFLGRVMPRAKATFAADEAPSEELAEAEHTDTEKLNPSDLGLLLGLGGLAYYVSGLLTDAINGAIANPDVKVPFALVITTLALVLAQVPAVARLRGTRVLGMFALYLFLAVIGALCDLSALERLGELAGTLWIFASVVILVHGLVCFGAAGIFKLDWDLAAVASQANVGGGTSAIAAARSLERSDLVLPAILLGSLGTTIGTPLGILAVEFLL